MTLKILNKNTYSNPHMVKLKTKEAIERYGGIGYRYLIKTSNYTPLSAFKTKSGMKRYLNITGLKLKLVERKKEVDSYDLEGSYTEISMAGTAAELDRFGRKRNLKRGMILSNGDYTTAWYKSGKIYYLNPNYPRRILPYRHE